MSHLMNTYSRQPVAFVRGEGAWLYQSVLLGSRSDMDDIVSAIAKVYENRHALAGAELAGVGK